MSAPTMGPGADVRKCGAHPALGDRGYPCGQGSDAAPPIDLRLSQLAR